MVDGDLFHLDDETVLMSPTVDGQGPITDAELDEGGVPLKHDAFDLLAYALTCHKLRGITGRAPRGRHRASATGPATNLVLHGDHAGRAAGCWSGQRRRVAAALHRRPALRLRPVGISL